MEGDLMKGEPMEGDMMEEVGDHIPHIFNQKLCEQKLVEFVIRDEMPFKIVENEGFIELMHEMEPLFDIPDWKEIVTGVRDLYLKEKAKLASVIKEHKVSITIDTWSSMQDTDYLVVTAHFIDKDWRLQKRVLNFVQILSHSGDEIGRCLEDCFRGWKIEKVFAVVVDNFPANDMAINHIGKRFKYQNTLLSKGKYFPLQCTCHIINLIVKDGLEEFKCSVEAIRNAVLFLHSSPLGLHTFREFAMLEKFERTSIVPIDVKARWNSTYKMLEMALKYRKVFDRMKENCVAYMKYFEGSEESDEEYFEECEEENLKRVGPPADEDWGNVMALLHFLKMFYECTLKLGATKTPTSYLIFDCWVAISIEIARKENDESDPIFQRVALSMKQKIDKYRGCFESMNPLMFVANVLDPRNKLLLITVSLKRIGTDQGTVDGIVSKIKHHLLSLLNEYIGEEECKPRGDGEGIEQKESQNDILAEIYDEIEQQKRDQLQEISNEVDRYLWDPIEPRKKHVDFNLLDWWKGSELRYPVLSKVAKDIFSIPSSTVSNESMFSLGNPVLSYYRSSLTPYILEALVCTKDWLTAEDPDEYSIYKDPTDRELELYLENEEIEQEVLAGLPSMGSPELGSIPNILLPGLKRGKWI